MDLVGGAFAGAGVAYVLRYFSNAKHGNDIGVVCPSLEKSYVKVNVARFKVLRDASAKADELYVEFVTIADAIVRESATRGTSQFKFNRLCAKLKTRCKELCIEAAKNRDFMLHSRQLHLDEFPAIERFCYNSLHNMILSG